jgi:hypothetical protein
LLQVKKNLRIGVVPVTPIVLPNNAEFGPADPSVYDVLIGGFLLIKYVNSNGLINY